MTRRGRILSYGLASVLVVAGIAIAVAVGTTLGQALGFVAIAAGLVLATSLVFFEVGLSEDRERAREQAAREREGDTRASHQSDRSPRVRLPRARGRRRRIR